MAKATMAGVMRNLTNKKVALALTLSLCAWPISGRAQAPSAHGNQPLVTVGTQKISLNAAVNKDALRKMVFTSLVRQAAVKAGVMPTERDVDVRIHELSGRQPALAQQAANPSVRADLKTDLALENLRIQNVTVSEAQIAAFYNSNKSLFTLPSQVQTTMVVSQNRADTGHAEMMLKQNQSPQAIAAKPGLHVAGLNGYRFNMGTLSAGMREKIGKTVLAMKQGQVATVPVSGGSFLTFKVKSAHGNELSPLSQVKDQVSRQLRLLKAVSAQVELARLYQANPPHFSDPKIKAYFSDIERFHPHP
jgi:foldase protein PrsA